MMIEVNEWAVMYPRRGKSSLLCGLVLHYWYLLYMPCPLQKLLTGPSVT